MRHSVEESDATTRSVSLETNDRLEIKRCEMQMSGSTVGFSSRGRTHACLSCGKRRQADRQGRTQDFIGGGWIPWPRDLSAVGLERNVNGERLFPSTAHQGAWERREFQNEYDAL